MDFPAPIIIKLRDHKGVYNHNVYLHYKKQAALYEAKAELALYHTDNSESGKIQKQKRELDVQLIEKDIDNHINNYLTPDKTLLFEIAKIVINK